MGGAFHAAGGFGDTAKGTGHQEDKEHDGDIHIADTLGAELYIIHKEALAVLHKGHNQGQTEGHHHGHDIEAHLSFHRCDVFIPDACAQIEQEKDQYGKQRESTRLRLRCVLFHIFIILCQEITNLTSIVNIVRNCQMYVYSLTVIFYLRAD